MRKILEETLKSKKNPIEFEVRKKIEWIQQREQMATKRNTTKELYLTNTSKLLPIEIIPNF